MKQCCYFYPGCLKLTTRGPLFHKQAKLTISKTILYCNCNEIFPKLLIKFVKDDLQTKYFIVIWYPKNNLEIEIQAFFVVEIQTFLFFGQIIKKKVETMV